MKTKILLLSILLVIAARLSIQGVAADNSDPLSAPLQPEPLMQVQVLPEDYPDSWFFAHDTNFYSLIGGRVILLDAAADSHEYKGALDASQFASFVESTYRPELYVGETFYSRGTSGVRTDVVSIYDKVSFLKKAEIILPNSNRGLFVTNKNALQLVDRDRFLLVFNFTPASSVTVIDTERQEIVNEIALPGCSLIYPTGERGFSSLCGDGSMISIQFDSSGSELSRRTLDAFFDADQDPVFDKPVFLDGIAYFVSYLGRVIPIDLRAAEPIVLPIWQLVNEKDTKQNWRPSGWQIVSGNSNKLFVIFAKDGFNGSHKSGGEEIWVFDISTQKRIRKIKTQSPAFSLEHLPSQPPLLVVTNTNMGIDIYNLSGKLQRSIIAGDVAMPLVLHAVK